MGGYTLYGVECAGWSQLWFCEWRLKMFSVQGTGGFSNFLIYCAVGASSRRMREPAKSRMITAARMHVRTAANLFHW